MEKITVWKISCSTGCSCCSSDNHYRGPYRTEKDARRRVRYYLSTNSTYWPLASQFAKRGHYVVYPVEVELLPDGRWVRNNSNVESPRSFVEVAQDGTVRDNESEFWYNDI